MLSISVSIDFRKLIESANIVSDHPMRKSSATPLSLYKYNTDAL